MIKHLAPRSEEEIFENSRQKIIDVALGKINSQVNAISYNRVSVYLNTHDIEDDYYVYDPIYFYEVIFKLIANHWECEKIEKRYTYLMNKNWFTTQNMADGNPMKRPYDTSL